MFILFFIQYNYQQAPYQISKQKSKMEHTRNKIETPCGELFWVEEQQILRVNYIHETDLEGTKQHVSLVKNLFRGTPTSNACLSNFGC